MSENVFDSTGSWGGDIEKSEEMFLDGQLERLPSWHPVTHMYEEEITRDFLTYLRKIRSLEKDLKSVRDAMFQARVAKDDVAELAACQEILAAWTAFSPLRQEAIERFEADYYIDRMSIILLRLKRPDEAMAVINTYYQGPFYDHCKQFRSAKHQAIAKRLERTKALAKKNKG